VQREWLRAESARLPVPIYGAGNVYLLTVVSAITIVFVRLAMMKKHITATPKAQIELQSCSV
jgi:hypothetical protein